MNTAADCYQAERKIHNQHCRPNLIYLKDIHNLASKENVKTERAHLEQRIFLLLYVE